VLDLACGSGRHSRLLAAAGFRVLAVDRNADALASLARVPGVTTLPADLEGEAWPLAGRRFSGVVVTNYLWRPRLPNVLELLLPGGVLIYETFMAGNERYGKPTNPDFLLRSQELLDLARVGSLTVLAYEEGYAGEPRPALRQAICARQA
jgi:SAM-dependent methyltransferase